MIPTEEGSIFQERFADTRFSRVEILHTMFEISQQFTVESDNNFEIGEKDAKLRLVDERLVGFRTLLQRTFEELKSIMERYVRDLNYV